MKKQFEKEKQNGKEKSQQNNFLIKNGTWLIKKTIIIWKLTNL